MLVSKIQLFQEVRMLRLLAKTALVAVMTCATIAKADTDKLDNLAACAGVVLGNGAVDFFLGDEASFDAAAEVAYTAYLVEVMSGAFSQNDPQIADQILSGNLDKVITAYNSEAFDNDLYEEIVSCYRQLPIQLIEKAELISSRKGEWKDLKDISVNTIKRMVKAG